MPVTTRQAKEIFLDAVEITDPQQREEFLAKECGDNAQLLAEIQELLQHHQALGDFFATGPLAETTASTKEDDSAETAGTVIGPYKLLQKIGEGGMGIVFMAEQTRPVQRKVALKVIKPGMDSKQVIARFEAERQALAMMDHVNIARVFDGGTTESGRPFFVMELVHGIPITKYCDDNHLTPRERLELFIPVCHAIQHAHQKGVIHRDIKPSNVLVTLYDGKPVAKVIDFGVAKATEQKLTERTMFTNFGMMVGTLEYMSPEQAEMSALGVDTRSDIYSLGVLLYELLTGSTPISRQQMKLAAYAEVLRIIKEEEPPRPSTRLSTSGEALATIAAQRKTEPAKLTKLVRGELDWIVMKTLEKDRNRRYETANAVARDVERYLGNEPVEARAPSKSYRIKKFVVRNRGAVAAASLILIALVVGVVGLSWGLVLADRERKIAEIKEAEAKQSAELALKRGNQIEKGNEILRSIFEKLDPNAEEKEDKALRVILGERLNHAVNQLQGEAIGDPLVVARLQQTLAESLLGLGYPEKAIGLIDQARTTFETILGPNHVETHKSLHTLGRAYHDNHNFDLAIATHEKVFQHRKSNLHPEHPDLLDSMHQLAESFSSARIPDKALPLFRDLLQLRKATQGPNHRDTLLCMYELAVVYQAIGKLELAEPLFKEVLDRRKACLPPDHPDTLDAVATLGTFYVAAGRRDQALPLLESALELQRKKLGSHHRSTLITLNNLAAVHYMMNDSERAIPLMNEVYRLMEQKFGPDNVATIQALGNLGISYQAAGNSQEGLKLLEEATRRVIKHHPIPQQISFIPGRLGDIYAICGMFEKAEPLLRERLNTYCDPNTPSEMPLRRFTLGQTLLGLKKYAEAEPLLLENYEALIKQESQLMPVTIAKMRRRVESIIQLFDETNRPQEAARWREELKRTIAKQEREKAKQQPDATSPKK